MHKGGSMNVLHYLSYSRALLKRLSSVILIFPFRAIHLCCLKACSNIPYLKVKTFKSVSTFNSPSLLLISSSMSSLSSLNLLWSAVDPPLQTVSSIAPPYPFAKCNPHVTNLSAISDSVDFSSVKHLFSFPTIKLTQLNFHPIGHSNFPILFFSIS